MLPKEHRESGKLAQRARIAVNLGPAAAYGKSNGFALLTPAARGKQSVVFALQVVFDNSVFPLRHGLQETLTVRQYCDSTSHFWTR